MPDPSYEILPQRIELNWIEGFYFRCDNCLLCAHTELQWTLIYIEDIRVSKRRYLLPRFLIETLISYVYNALQQKNKLLQYVDNT